VNYKGKKDDMIIITYWTNGDTLTTRRVDVDTLQEAVQVLENDPQEPLAQVKEWALLPDGETDV